MLSTDTIKMIKLCFIITGLSTGGAETMLFKLLQRLDLSRFTAEVISLTTMGEFGPRIEALGMPVTALGMRPGSPEAGAFVKLVKHLRQSKPDIVHTWMYHADLFGGIAARLARVNALAWCVRYSNLAPEHNKRATLMVVKACSWLSRHVPRRIVTCSEVARQVHIASGYRADKMVVIPNGFDLVRFFPDATARGALRQELGLLPETPIVGVVARDDPLKNHMGFIKAAAAVHAVLPDCHFVLAGQGIDSSHMGLDLAIAQEGLKEHVHLLGRRDDVPMLMAAFDVLASPSNGEAFPNVLGEAMACAVPCVVTDVGDSAEIVGPTGRVVAAGDMNGMAEALLAILNMPAEERDALGAMARARVQERYELGDVIRRYENFYNELLRDF